MYVAITHYFGIRIDYWYKCVYCLTCSYMLVLIWVTHGLILAQEWKQFLGMLLLLCGSVHIHTYVHLLYVLMYNCVLLICCVVGIIGGI